jgi:hypothetical protein
MFFVLVVAYAAAEARMYQWTNPQSGHTQLSGKPPAWYRGTTPGPRVQVFDNGKLVDDTATSVSDAERMALRGQALQELANRPKPPSPVAAQPAEVLSSEPDAGLSAALKALLAPERSKPSTDGAAKAPPAREADAAERLKAIIADWEKSKTERAKSLLEEQE